MQTDARRAETDRFGEELTTSQRDDLAKITRLGWAVYRYALYRRRGHDRSAAFRYTLCWARNSTEQHARRLSHETGAENWIGMWPR